MAWYFYLAIIAAGFIAGFINTLAGSGSLVTLPLLIFLGLPATLANGTNRVAVVMQNLVGTVTFRHNGMLDVRGVGMLSIPTVLGSILGAQIAADLNEELMRKAIGGVMILMLGVILLRPNRWWEGKLKVIDRKPNGRMIFIFFLIGMYGGFIQAGIGIFLLAALVLGVGYDLVRANAVKIGLNLFSTVAALGVFVLNHQVDWFIGFILALGNMLGAWLAAKLAIQRGAVWVWRFLIVVVVFSAADLLGVFGWIGRWLASG